MFFLSSRILTLLEAKENITVRSFLEGDENCELIKEELGINATTGLLFHLSKTLLFVEGVADKVCIEKFTELLGYDLSDYHIHICDGHSILQLCYLCHQYKFPYKAVLDEDNKYKGEQFKKSHLMYEECMKVIKDSPEKCIFVGEGKDGSLEDLFDDPKGAFTYFHTNKHIDKIDKDKVKKIKSVESLSKKTLENFEQLFIKLGLSKLDK